MSRTGETAGRLEIVLDDLQKPHEPPNSNATAGARRARRPSPGQPAAVASRGRPGQPRMGGTPSWVLVAAGVVVAIAVVAATFLIGQGTRKSDAQVASERQAAVAAAVASTRQADRLVQVRLTTAAVAEQQRHDTRIVRRVRRRLQRSAEERSRQSYASGQSAGYTSGQAAGYQSGTQDGLRRGSDDLTCSDDPDVGWLPYCP